MELDASSIGTNAFGLFKTVRITGQAAGGVLAGKISKAPSVVFDCCMTEEHGLEAIPTEFEVENGSTISDHVIVKPRTLRIQAMVSDAPLSILNSILTTGVGFVAQKTGASTGKLGANAGAVALLPAVAQSIYKARPSVTAFATLVAMQQARLPVEVFTTLNNYKNMWIRKISLPRDAMTGSSIIVNIEFQQLLLVQPEEVGIGALMSPDVASGEKGGGNLGSGDNALIDAGKATAAKTLNAFGAPIAD